MKLTAEYCGLSAGENQRNPPPDPRYRHPRKSDHSHWLGVCAVLFIVSLTLSGAVARCEVSCWDAASEFHKSENPSGVWSYGWKKTLMGQFFLARTRYGREHESCGWSSASGNPAIVHNGDPVAAKTDFAGVTLPPHGLALWPGLSSEYAVLRFTAPADGAYKVSGQFYALDERAGGTTTDVWILADANKVFSGKIDYSRGARSASFTSKVLQLKKGELLDFQVGYGADKSSDCDATGLAAVIEGIR